MSDLTIFNNSKEEVNLDYWQEICQPIFNRSQKKNADLSVSLVFVGQERIRELNKTYAGLDEITDILSFPIKKGLGDIFICWPQAVAQAKTGGKKIENEVCFLFAHGLAHLLGFDHQNSYQQKEMNSIIKELIS